MVAGYNSQIYEIRKKVEWWLTEAEGRRKSRVGYLNGYRISVL
jgi:hypothetical protein